MLFDELPPDTSIYMIAGYAVFFVVTVIYLGSLFIRTRNLNRDLATLEEVQRAALILQVSDASSPISAEQDAQVESVLKELEADKKPRLRVMNKIDLLPAKQRESLRDDEQTVHVSAVKGAGLSTLLDRIDTMLEEDRPSRVRLRIPQREGKALALLQALSPSTE